MKKTVFIIAVITIMLGIASGECLAAGSIKKYIKTGNKFYEQGDYSKALDEYNRALSVDSENHIANYNAGAALYKLKDYEKAREYFRRGVTSQDEPLAVKSAYNLGNAEYLAGIAKEDTDISSAVSSLEESIRHYENVIAKDSNDQDAVNNHEFVKTELERLREKLKQQEQESRGQESDKEKDSSGSEDKSSGDGESQREAQKTPADQGESDTDKPDRESPQQADEERDYKHDEYGSEQGSETQKPKEQYGFEGEISESTAYALLDNYLRNEQPREIYSEKLQPQREVPVDKDW